MSSNIDPKFLESFIAYLEDAVQHDEAPEHLIEDMAGFSMMLETSGILSTENGRRRIVIVVKLIVNEVFGKELKIFSVEDVVIMLFLLGQVEIIQQLSKNGLNLALHKRVMSQLTRNVTKEEFNEQLKVLFEVVSGVTGQGITIEQREVAGLPGIPKGTFYDVIMDIKKKKGNKLDGYNHPRISEQTN